VEKKITPTFKKRPKATLIDTPLNEMEQQQFKILREWRKQKADELDVPAFVILSDRSLREVTRTNPTTLSDLKKVHGFGEVKLDRFGPEILEIIVKQ